MQNEILFKHIRAKYKIKKIKIFINEKFLVQMEIEFYLRPTKYIIKFLEIFLSGFRVKKIYTSFTSPNSVIVIFEKYTHRNVSFQILDALSKFIDYNTKIILEYTKNIVF